MARMKQQKTGNAIGQSMTSADSLNHRNVQQEDNDAKRKQSTLEISNETNEEPNQAKRPRSEPSVPVASSSWIQRIVASPPETSRTKSATNVPSTKGTDHSHETVPGPDHIVNPKTNAQDHANVPVSAKPTSEGIWSWLGYEKHPTELATKNNHHGESTAKDEDNWPSSKSSNNPDKDTSSTNTSSWRSFFWSSKQEDNNSHVQAAAKVAPEDEKQPLPAVNVSAENNKQDEKGEPPISPETILHGKNVVLPSIYSQYTVPNRPPPTILTKALSAIQSMFTAEKPHPLNRSKPFMSKRLATFIDSLKTNPDTIPRKRIVIVGVHGWFPMKLVRSMVGEPTGTSVKFCEQMNLAVKRYFQVEHNLNIPESAITCIPLEGEGKVEKRVEILYKSLKDHPSWLEALMTADVIFWATHSQGTPVSAMLLHQLLEEKRISLETQAICLLAMAGISHGPFPWLKDNLLVKYFEADAARELFEFMDSESVVAKTYQASMAYLLESGVKTVLVGSMQDQVVPLYSAIMTNTSHPNIYRTLYVDGHVYSEDDFLIQLIAFALRLRNAGYSDHGLLAQVSEVLAGNLYAWEGGHSTVYEEIGVFTTAVRFLFETTPFGRLVSRKRSNESPSDSSQPTVIHPVMDPFRAKVRQNPYYLPWAMRGIYDDADILSDTLFRDELDRLKQLLRQWTPSSSKLREIKFRLEPLRSRL